MSSRPTRLFDLDGTLADTAGDIAAALDATLGDLGLPPAGLKQTRLWIGGGADKLISRAVESLNTQHQAIDQTYALALFLERYWEFNGTQAALYEGVADTLKQLQQRGIALAVVTNKPYALAVNVIAQLGIADHFEYVIGGDSLPHKKPHPATVLAAMKALASDPETCWMIGDSAADVDGARNAGIKVAWVSYGYHRGRTAADLKPDRALDTFTEVSTLG